MGHPAGMATGGKAMACSVVEGKGMHDLGVSFLQILSSCLFLLTLKRFSQWTDRGVAGELEGALEVWTD